MPKKNKRYRLVIAVNLIPKMRELENNPLPITGFTVSRMLYLISLIISHKQDNHPGAYSLLNMFYMSNVVPGAGQYLKYLKKENIIEWVNHSAGRNSRMYRLINEGRTEYRTLTDKKLINRIEKARRDIKKQNSKKYPTLNGYIHKIKINASAALKTVERVYIENLKADPLKAEGRRTFSLCEIEKIESGEIYIRCNSTNGRLDSNFTRLPSELLQHLTINGNPLIELDICNSQPFFAAALLSPTPEIERIISRVLGHSYTMLVRSLQIAECKDVKLYTSLVLSCSFYDPFLMEKFREYGIPFIDRDDLKEQLFIIFFGKCSAERYSPQVKLFKAVFPNVYRMFCTIKSGGQNKLAILLQRIESYTILERVSKKILAELPGVPFITRHDSLLPSVIMIAEQEARVGDIMEETIKEVTGLTPKIRIKGATPLFSYYKVINSLILFSLSSMLVIPL